MSKKAIWAAVVLVTTVLAGAIYMYTRTLEIYHNEACVKNLNHLYLVLRNYSNDAPQEVFPPLSNVAGRLMFDTSSLTPEDLYGPEYLISRYHPDVEELFRIAETTPVEAIDDHSYWYLGYTILSEPVLESFVEAYKVAIVKGEPVPEIDEIFPEAREAVEERREKRRIEIDAYLERVEAEGGDPSRVKASYNVPLGNDERNARLILRNGIERFFVYEIGNPMAGEQEAATIPVLIERPKLHGDGGHVLFLDGHVEFISYPGKFPMTEEYIAGLRTLDALGAQ